MIRFKGLRGAALVWSACLPSLSGAAEEGRVDQVERADAEAGETELELQLIHLPPAGGEQAAWAANLTLEHGISDRFSLGIEIETEAEDGAGLEVDTIGLQAKWVSPAGAGVRFGIQPGFQFAPESGDVGSETFLIAETRAGQIDLVANAVVATEPGDLDSIALSYGMRADVSLSGRWIAGLEAGGELSGPEDREGDAHWAGPVLARKPDDEASIVPAVELSLFLPLTDDTPDLQLRLELDRAF